MSSRLKAFTGIGVLLLYALAGILILILVWNQKLRRRMQASLISMTSKVLLKIIGVKVRVVGSIDLSVPNLVVSNHHSYIDVMVISSVIPSIFVTSTDTKKSLVEGPLTSLGGCLMVNRQDKSNQQNEIAEIAQVLGMGLSVAFFPEATTSNGETLLRFRRPLFQAAFISKLSILPLCLNYETIDGDTLNFENRSGLFAIDPIPVTEQIGRLLKIKSIEVELRILAPIEIENLKDITDAAEKSQREITKYFKPVVTRPNTRVEVHHSERVPSPNQKF